MAEKKSRDKTVKGGGRKPSLAAMLRETRKFSKNIAAVLRTYDPELGKPRLVRKPAKKAVVREMPGVPRGIMVLRPDQLDSVGLPAELVAAIRSDFARAQSQHPQVERDVTAEQVEQDLQKHGQSGLLVNSCGEGCHVNITIARPHIIPLREGSEELTAVAQLPIETIPDLVKTLREMCETRGVACP